MFGFFRKKGDNGKLKRTIESMQNSLKISFENIKKDFSTIDNHHNEFHKKHVRHEKKHTDQEERIRDLHERLLILESIVDVKKTSQPIRIEPETEEVEELEELTEVSRKICYILAALAQENKELVTLKTLAEEMYPGKDYQKIRSTVSQYTTELEELGYVQKKKKGRNVYIKSTEKNPFLKEKIVIKKKIKQKSKT